MNITPDVFQAMLPLERDSFKPLSQPNLIFGFDFVQHQRDIISPSYLPHILKSFWGYA